MTFNETYFLYVPWAGRVWLFLGSVHTKRELEFVCLFEWKSTSFRSDVAKSCSTLGIKLNFEFGYLLSCSCKAGKSCVRSRTSVIFLLCGDGCQ